MSRYYRDTPDYSWVFELLFIALGLLGFALHWPVLLCLVLLAMGGVIFLCTNDSDGGGGWDWDFNPFD